MFRCNFVRLMTELIVIFTKIGQSSQSQALSDQLTTHHIHKLTIPDITWTVIYQHKPMWICQQDF